MRTTEWYLHSSKELGNLELLLQGAKIFKNVDEQKRASRS